MTTHVIDSSGVVTLPNIEEGSPYLIDIATDCLLTETMALSKQVSSTLILPTKGL